MKGYARNDLESADRLTEIAFRTPEGFLPFVVSHLHTPAVRVDTMTHGKTMLDDVGEDIDFAPA